MIVAQLLLELLKNKIRPVSKNHPVLYQLQNYCVVFIQPEGFIEVRLSAKMKV